MKKFNSLEELAESYIASLTANADPMSIEEVVEFNVDEKIAARANDLYGINEDIYVIPGFGYVGMEGAGPETTDPSELHRLQSIVITPEQIIAAAQKIADKDENAWESTPEVYLAAVRNYLNACFSDILADADWHADKDNFTVGTKYDPSFCDEATELVLPAAPEWAHQEISPALQ